MILQSCVGTKVYLKNYFAIRRPWNVSDIRFPYEKVVNNLTKKYI